MKPAMKDDRRMSGLGSALVAKEAGVGEEGSSGMGGMSISVAGDENRTRFVELAVMTGFEGWSAMRGGVRGGETWMFSDARGGGAVGIGGCCCDLEERLGICMSECYLIWSICQARAYTVAGNVERNIPRLSKSGTKVSGW